MLKQFFRKVFRLKEDPQPWQNRPLVPGIAPTYGSMRPAPAPVKHRPKKSSTRGNVRRPMTGRNSPPTFPRPVAPPPPPRAPARRVDVHVSQKKRDDDDDIDPFLSAAVDIGAALAVDALLDSFSSDSSSSSDSSFGSDSGSSDWGGSGGDSGGGGADGSW